MNTSKGILYWSPRILCILSILFLTIFSFDVFEGEASFWSKLVDFFIHNIPAIILSAVLVFAWKKERIGGLAFLILGIVFGAFVFYHNYIVNRFDFWNCLWIVLIIAFPFIIVGLLFLAHARQEQKLQ